MSDGEGFMTFRTTGFEPTREEMRSALVKSGLMGAGGLEPPQTFLPKRF